MSAVQYRFAVSDAAGEPRELIVRRADAGGLTVALTGATPALPLTMTEDDAADLGCHLIALARYGAAPPGPARCSSCGELSPCAHVRAVAAESEER